MTVIYFTYLFYVYYMSTQNKFHFLEKTQKENIEWEKKAQQAATAAAAQVQQNPSPAILKASSVLLPFPGTPVVATPVSSPQITPQNTPHTAGSVGLPSTPYETPHMSRHKSYCRRAARPASTIDSLEMLHATPNSRILQ